MRMSVYSGKSNLTSILKNYCPKGREKSKEDIVNKVRFEVPREKRISEIVEAVCSCNDVNLLNEYLNFLGQTSLKDDEFIQVIHDAHIVVRKLDAQFIKLVECLLSLSWSKRSPEAIKVFSDFCIELLMVHTNYANFGITKFVALWVPDNEDEALWLKGYPVANVEMEMSAIHRLIDRILAVIPLTFDIVLQAIDIKFPYFKKAPHVTVGYIHNLLHLISYKPIFTECVIQLIIQKLVVLDVNAPRCEIEEAEENEIEPQMGDEQIFQMDDCCTDKLGEVQQYMKHPIANTLDCCMEKLFEFFDTKYPKELANSVESQTAKMRTHSTQFLKILIDVFDKVVLPIHDPHHVQFFLFYYCSLHSVLAETFLSSLWNKIINPNISAVLRQAAVGYMASFIARSKILSFSVLEYYLKALCNWARQYIERSDQYRSNGSLKANLVFFSVCQAIFYLIAFRSRDLTGDKKSLSFLQSLHLSTLVTCNFNPLRVCQPAVATAFAGVTRAYQLAYCHAILERNARRKLPVEYASYTATPEEVLDIFFPFDPYMLKISGCRIAPYYLPYQTSEVEGDEIIDTNTNKIILQERKRHNSELVEDIDFFMADKRPKIVDLVRSQERAAQFTYGLSPGFHT